MSDETLGSFGEFYERAKGAYVISVYLYYQNPYTDLPVRVEVQKASRTGYFFYVSTERLNSSGTKYWCYCKVTESPIEAYRSVAELCLLP
jgi:hypothetical protein